MFFAPPIDAAAVLPANSALTSGVGTFSTTLNTAVTQRITATDTVTPSITGTSAGIAVNAPTIYDVLNSNDSGTGSLRAAINEVIVAASPGLIAFDPSVTGAITLLSPLPALTESMIIAGPGASTLAIDGNNAVQVFYVTSGVTATISGLTIQHGLDTSAGIAGGGGVRNEGVLTLSSCVVTGNSQTGNGFGGGIFNNSGATLTVSECTVANNTAMGIVSSGGGLYNAGTTTVLNSTFSGNIAAGGSSEGGEGGAINTEGFAATTIIGSTISGNTVTDPQNAGAAQGGGIFSAGVVVVKNSTISGNSQAGTDADQGGGIWQDSGPGRSVALTNTILAGNTDASGVNPDGGGPFTDGGNNLIGVGVIGISNGSNGNQAGTSGTPLTPHLSALANNGGPTQTMLPNGNSPALGAGNIAGFLSTDTDQRGTGFLRLANGVTDIGAVQLQGVALTAVAGTTPQSANANAAFGNALAATATESCGACASVIPGVSVTFTAPGTGASGTFGAGATVTTNASGVATAPAFTANATPGGPYNVTASGSTPDQATAASATFALTNVALTQTITGFGPIGTQVYGAVFLINGVAATSGQPVTFTSTTLSVCTVSGNAVSVVGTGPCSIVASQAGGGSYAAAPNVPQSFTANQAPLTVNVQSTSKAYGAALPAFTTGSVQGVTHGDTVGTTITISLLSTATAASPVNGVNGYPITATVGGTSAANYTITNNPGLLTINAVGLTVAVNPQTKAYGAALPTLTGDVNGLVNGDTVGGTITVAYSTTALANSTVAGAPYPITALVGGSAINNYTLTNTPNQLTVTQVGLTVAVAVQTKVYGAALPTLTGNVTGLVNGDTVGGTITVTYSTTALAGSGVAGDPYPITALVGGSALTNYTLTNTPNVLTVTPATLTVRANSASIISGATIPTLAASITGFVNGDTQAVVTGAPGLSTTATTGSSAGTYPITVTLGTLAAANYTFSLVNGTLTLTPLEPVSISVVSGSGQSGAPGTPFAAPLIALVTDNLCGPMSNAEVFFTVVSGPAMIGSQAVYTAGDGTARITATPTGAEAIVISAATSNAIIAPADFIETGLVGSAPPQLSVLPSAITLTAVQGGANPLPTIIAVSNTGAGTLQWTASESGAPSWLSLSAASGITPTAISAGIVPAGLAPGVYKSTITVNSGSQQQTVAVNLTVVPAVPAQFSLAPAAFVVNTTVASNASVSRLINVENAGAAMLNWNAAAGAGASWLSVSPATGSTTSGKAPSTLTVQVNPSGLAAGQYLGNIAFTSPGVPPANVPVVLNVAALPNLISSVPAIELRLAVGSGAEATTLPITTSTGAAVSFTATGSVSNGANWLTLSSTSGVTPASIFVSGSNSGLTAGNYVGYVSVQSPGAANTLVVPVVLDLANFSTPGILAAAPGGVLFTGAATITPGTPLNRTIVLSSDAGSYTWNATALPGSGGSWLTVSPSTGSAVVGPSLVTVSANLTGLQPGSYTGQVAIGSTGTSNSELIIPVTLIVTNGTTAVTSGNTLQVIQPAGDFVAASDVPVALQASFVDPTGQPITGATVQVTFTTGDVPVTLTDAGGGNYTGTWSPTQTGPVSLLFNGPNSPIAIVTGTVSSTTGTQPAFTAAGVVSSADFLCGAPLTPGSIATIFGQNLAQIATATSYPLPLMLGGTSVTINGIPAPLFYTGSGQINFFVPYELAGQTTATIVISSAAGVAEVTGIPIAPESPSFYLEDAAGDASAVHLSGQLVSAADPATANETIEIYATGLGAVSNAPIDGMGASGNPLSHDQTPPVITIGGMNAQISYAGLAPGFAGLYQLNVLVPAGLRSGANQMTISVGPLSGNTAVLQVQ